LDRKLMKLLPEVNLASNALAWRSGKHPGYEQTAWDGIEQTIDVIAQKGIRVVINGGALDPKALAVKVQALVSNQIFRPTSGHGAEVPLTKGVDF
jgi:hypothetical protein